MKPWAIDSIEIGGGFLSDLVLHLPLGLTCIIGPRGSGKSTLAEAIRLVLSGVPVDGAKARQELTKANLGGTVVTLTTRRDSERGGFTVRRSYGQTAVITAPDSRPVMTIELDRGTFLPLDAYSSLDIEGIADESLGSKRRALLDDLCSSEMEQVRLTLSNHMRALEANAESIKATQRKIRELTEQIEELGDVKAKFDALPTDGKREGTPEFQAASRQKQINEREASRLEIAIGNLARLRATLPIASRQARAGIETPLVETESKNEALLNQADLSLNLLWQYLDQTVARVSEEIDVTSTKLSEISYELREAHAKQEAVYLSLQHENQEAVRAFEARTSAERDILTCASLQQQRSEAQASLTNLQEERKNAKASYILARDRVSELREGVARRLQDQSGPKVRIRVQRNADVLEYQQQLLSALYGSKLKNQDDILRSLCSFRPEDLALIIREDDLVELETHAGFGKERGRKILDALRHGIEPLALEVLQIDDRIMIELDVSKNDHENFKDASELSRGQKCTALLPILLARRDSPLIIDQPEDNLDNHFIYETVVDSILRLKSRRQMIFITHNANIPVLGEAELVVVMNSDGRHGFVEKAGTVDECRDEVIDLLEGGEEAFELRRKRYET